MIHLYFALALTLGALVAAGMAVREYLRWRRSLVVMERADLPVPVATAAPIPVRLLVYLIALVVALIAPLPVTIVYKASIGFVLLLLLLMELLLTIPGTPTIVRTGTNVALYFVLWLGFAATVGRALWSAGGLVALLPVLLAVLYWWLVRKKLGYLQISVIVYMVNAVLVLCFAAALFATRPALWTLFGLLGALAYVGVDAVRGCSAFRVPVANSEFYQMILCMLASLMLAWSVWGELLPSF